MSFLKLVIFLFFRKMEKNLYRGYILVRQKNGENANRNLWRTLPTLFRCSVSRLQSNLWAITDLWMFQKSLKYFRRRFGIIVAVLWNMPFVGIFWDIPTEYYYKNLFFTIFYKHFNNSTLIFLCVIAWIDFFFITCAKEPIYKKVVKIMI